ncbi:MAG: hypothetical protein M1826_000663 [Phylliscum demangeonii]|nr:MAG: hypothetical protein M1826_000663 [Phylliscum demangeonii]
MRLFGTHLAVLGLLSAAHPAVGVPVTPPTTNSGGATTGEVAGRASSIAPKGPAYLARWKIGAAAAAVGTTGLVVLAVHGRQESGGVAGAQPPTESYEEREPLKEWEEQLVQEHVEKMKDQLAAGMTDWDESDRAWAKALWWVCMRQGARAEFRTTVQGSGNIVEQFFLQSLSPGTSKKMTKIDVRCRKETRHEIARQPRTSEARTQRAAEREKLAAARAESWAKFPKANAAPEDNPMAFGLHQVQNLEHAVQNHAVVAAVEQKAAQLQHWAQKAVMPAMMSVPWSQLERSATKNAVALEAKLKYAGE